jgi:hypothetical protein
MGRRADFELGHDTEAFFLELEEQADPREAYARVQDRIRAYREAGWQVPEDLKRVERQMMTDFMAESQGR